MLCLLDIDGTLFRGSAEHAVALVEALEEAYGVPISPEALGGLDYAGRTDRWIARRLLELSGVGEDAFEERREHWVAETARRFEELAPPDMSERLLSGVEQGIRMLAGEGLRLALLTGNVEPVAHGKMERCGIGATLARGAYGSDAEERSDLVPIALGRAGGPTGDWPAEETVVVGDTPHDIACARAAGTRVLAVATGPFTPAELEGADAVVADFEEAVQVLLAWRG